MNYKKIISLLLCSSLIISTSAVFAGCNKENSGGLFGSNKADVKTVADDAIWYDAVECKVDMGYEDVLYIDYSYPVAVGDRVYVAANGSYEYDMPDYSFDDEFYDFDEFSDEEVDLDEEVIGEFDGDEEGLEEVPEDTDEEVPEESDEEGSEDPDGQDGFVEGELVVSDMDPISEVVEPDFDYYDGFDYSEYLIRDVVEIDFEGNVIAKYDMGEVWDGDMYVNSSFVTDDGITFLAEFYDEMYNSTYGVFTFDLETKTFSDVEPFDVDYDSMNEYIETVYPLADGSLMLCIYKFDTSNYEILILKDGGVIESLTSEDLTGYNDCYDLSSFMTLDDGSVFFKAYTESGINAGFKFDINTYTAEPVETDSSFDEIWNTSLASDGKSYSIDDEGICVINSETMSTDLVLNFNDTDINKYTASSYSVLSNDEDKIVLAGSVYNPISADLYYNGEFQICTLTKADQNPNIGKKILSIGIVNGYVTYSLSEAINIFNETNSEYFATLEFIDAEYLDDNYVTDDGSFDQDAYMNDYNAANATMTNELAINLMSGEAPDIIMSAFQFSQLNNSDYLLDLSELFTGADAMDTSDLFMNVINAAYTGDALYQIPVAFSVRGIAALPEDAPANGIGYTMDEYPSFVAESCNGTDPVYYGTRLSYFTDILAYRTDLFMDEEGKINFQNDDFYAFADYFLDNIPEAVQDDAMYYCVDYSDESFSTPEQVYLYDIRYNDLTNGTVTKMVYGYSLDGKGPVADIDESIAVSATTANEEAAMEFVKLILGKEYQDNAAYESANPICVSSAYAACAAMVEANNDEYYREASMGLSDIELMQNGWVLYDDEFIDNYIEILGNVSSVTRQDSAVMQIVLEEMPAFFAGQKTIEEVAQIIDNRAQTVVDERG